MSKVEVNPVANGNPKGGENRVAKRAYSWLAMGIALGAGAGRSPVAPGTVGTLVGWLLFLVLQMLTYRWRWFWPVFLLLGFVVGCWACKVAAEHLQRQDPSAVVWDEIWAICLIFYVVQPEGVPISDGVAQLVLFALFRLFDAVKRGPVGWVDARFKGFGWWGAFGIMLDDVVAAWLVLLVASGLWYMQSYIYSWL